MFALLLYLRLLLKIHKSNEYLARTKLLEESVQSGISVEQVVDMLFKGMKEDRFYIVTKGADVFINARNSDILAGRQPNVG